MHYEMFVKSDKKNSKEFLFFIRLKLFRNTNFKLKKDRLITPEIWLISHILFFFIRHSDLYRIVNQLFFASVSRDNNRIYRIV